MSISLPLIAEEGSIVKDGIKGTVSGMVAAGKNIISGINDGIDDGRKSGDSIDGALSSPLQPNETSMTIPAKAAMKVRYTFTNLDTTPAILRLYGEDIKVLAAKSSVNFYGSARSREASLVLAPIDNLHFFTTI